MAAHLPKSELRRIRARVAGLLVLKYWLCKNIFDNLCFRLKTIIQDAVKLAYHSKRANLTTQDVDFTLKMKHYEVG